MRISGSNPPRDCRSSLDWFYIGDNCVESQCERMQPTECELSAWPQRVLPATVRAPDEPDLWVVLGLLKLDRLAAEAMKALISMRQFGLGLIAHGALKRNSRAATIYYARLICFGFMKEIGEASPLHQSSPGAAT